MASDGAFRVATGAALPTADDAWILVRSPGWAPVAIRLDDDQRRAFSEKGSVEGVRVVLRRAATVEGRVRHPGGAPFAQARVGLSRDPFAREPDDDQAVTTTDDDGRYVLTEADPRGELYLVVEAWSSWMRPVRLEGAVALGRTKTVDVDMIEGSEATLEVNVPAKLYGLRVVFDGGSPSTLGDEPLLRVPTTSGPHRLKVLDADGTTRFETGFEIPAGERAFRASLGF